MLDACVGMWVCFALYYATQLIILNNCYVEGVRGSTAAPIVAPHTRSIAQEGKWHGVPWRPLLEQRQGFVWLRNYLSEPGYWLVCLFQGLFCADPTRLASQ